MVCILHRLRELYPPERWKFPVIVLLGILSGIAVYALYVSNAVSYLSDSPRTCVNCHVMAPHYTTWFHSAHREYATCNDCHVPQDNIFRHYYFKAQDGMRHAYIFTMNKSLLLSGFTSPGKRWYRKIACAAMSTPTTGYMCRRAHLPLSKPGKTGFAGSAIAKFLMARLPVRQVSLTPMFPCPNRRYPTGCVASGNRIDSVFKTVNDKRPLL